MKLLRPVFTVLTAVTGLTVPPALAQVNYDTVQVRTTPAGKGVYMLQGVGGNLGLSVGADAAFLVDDQFALLASEPRPIVYCVPCRKTSSTGTTSLGGIDGRSPTDLSTRSR